MEGVAIATDDDLTLRSSAPYVKHIYRRPLITRANGELKRDSPGALRLKESRAPCGIIGERLRASRLPSLRSALRGLDPRLRSP